MSQLDKNIENEIAEIKNTLNEKPTTYSPFTPKKSVIEIFLSNTFGKFILIVIYLFLIYKYLPLLFSTILQIVTSNTSILQMQNYIGILATTWTLTLTILLMIIIIFIYIIKPKRYDEKISKIIKLYIILLILLVGWGIFFNPQNAQSNQIGSAISGNIQQTYQSPTFQMLGCIFNFDATNMMNCLTNAQSKKQSQVSNPISLEISPVSNTRRIYSVTDNNTPYYVFYKLRSNSNITLVKLECFSNLDSNTPFYVENLSNQIINTRGESIQKQFLCKNLLPLSLGNNNTVTITTKLYYTVQTSFQQEIPIINCNSQNVISYLSQNHILCQDLTLNDFQQISNLQNTWNPKASNNAITLTTQSFEAYFPLKYPITNAVQKEPIPLQISFQNAYSNLGTLQSGKILNIKLPISLTNLNSNSDNQIIQTNNELYWTLNLKQNPISNINSLPAYSIQQINILTQTTLENEGIFSSITFKKTTN